MVINAFGFTPCSGGRVAGADVDSCANEKRVVVDGIKGAGADEFDLKVDATAVELSEAELRATAPNDFALAPDGAGLVKSST